MRNLKFSLLLIASLAISSPSLTAAQGPAAPGTRCTRASGSGGKKSKKVNSSPSVALSVNAAGSPGAQTFGVTEAQRRRAVELLDRSPYLTDSPKDVLSEDEFTAAARSLFDIPAGDVRNAMDAIRILEKAIASAGPVKAVVTSDPSRLTVEYHRLALPGSGLNTTTDNRDLSLDPPATYVFTCTGPGDIKQTKTVSCASGCKVDFRF